MPMPELFLRGARRVRNATLAGVRAAGGFERIAVSEWRHQRLLILCYHGVSLRDEHEWDQELFVTPAFLRRRFEIVRDGGYVVLPLGEAVRSLHRGALPPRSVAITFDDGFHDFLSAAVPLLEEFGYPATNYISTYYSVHQQPLPNIALRYMLWCARRQVLAPGAFRGQEGSVDLHVPELRERLATSLLNESQVVSGGPEAQQALLAKVAGRLGIDWKNIVRRKLFHLMGADEVAEVARRGFDIQLHTHRHRTPRDKTDFCREVTENRRIIEKMTGQPARHFCYPSGDVDTMFLPWLRELEVETATTTSVADLANVEHDPLLLPRYVDTMAQSEVQFEAWLCGAGAFLNRRRT
jgi:peptidoglycan/xylan/chitin deacetylase (PgdA/CDA1 family)